AAAVAAAVAGPFAALSAQPLPGAAAGALPVPVAFAGTALTVRAPEVRQLLVAVKGKLAHAR
ncbi:virulence factor MviN, partial [Streptomyces inhibens]